MIRTYLEFDVLPGKADELVAFFAAQQYLENSVAQEGCHSAELTMSSDGLQAIVTATWDDREAYDRWTSRPDRESTGPALSALLKNPVGEGTIGRVFEVASMGVLETRAG